MTTGRETAGVREVADRREANRRLLIYLLLPTIFLTVALLGGVRVEGETRALVFLPPPLVTLILSVLLAGLFVRARLVELSDWLSGANAPIANVAHALTLGALFFASAQAFNSVLPESGLPRWLFSFFFLWALWQSQFAGADARRTLRSLAALFFTAFALKHLLVASLYAPDGGWLRQLAGAVFEGLTQGTVGAQQAYAPSNGYVSFFTLALYVGGLALLPRSPSGDGSEAAAEFIRDYERLDACGRDAVRAAIVRGESRRLEAARLAGAPAADEGAREQVGDVPASDQ
jgi:hypothetical protein